MSFFSKFKIGSTAYDVKDSLAGKSLSITNNKLNLLDADSNVLSNVDLPDSGGIVDIKIGTGNVWTTADGTKNVFDLPLDTIVRTSTSTGIKNFYNLKLIAADSPTQTYSSSEIAYTNLAPGGFIGVIVGKINNTTTTVVKRLDMDMQHFPTNISSITPWMSNQTNLSGLDTWIKNKYSIVSEENLTSSNYLVIKSLDESTTYTKTAATKYTLSNGLVLIGIELSQAPNEALKFSGSIINRLNVTMIGWSASPSASFDRATINSDFTASMPSDASPRNVILIYGHLL